MNKTKTKKKMLNMLKNNRLVVNARHSIPVIIPDNVIYDGGWIRFYSSANDLQFCGIETIICIHSLHLIAYTLINIFHEKCIYV